MQDLNNIKTATLFTTKWIYDSNDIEGEHLFVPQNYSIERNTILEKLFPKSIDHQHDWVALLTPEKILSMFDNLDQECIDVLNGTVTIAEEVTDVLNSLWEEHQEQIQTEMSKLPIDNRHCLYKLKKDFGENIYGIWEVNSKPHLNGKTWIYWLIEILQQKLNTPLEKVRFNLIVHEKDIQQLANYMFHVLSFKKPEDFKILTEIYGEPIPQNIELNILSFSHGTWNPIHNILCLTEPMDINEYVSKIIDNY